MCILINCKVDVMNCYLPDHYGQFMEVPVLAGNTDNVFKINEFRSVGKRNLNNLCIVLDGKNWRVV